MNVGAIRRAPIGVVDFCDVDARFLSGKPSVVDLRKSRDAIAESFHKPDWDRGFVVLKKNHVRKLMSENLFKILASDTRTQVYAVIRAFGKGQGIGGESAAKLGGKGCGGGVEIRIHLANAPFEFHLDAINDLLHAGFGEPRGRLMHDHGIGADAAIGVGRGDLAQGSNEEYPDEMSHEL